MEANYVHKDSATLVQDKLVKNELNQMELQYNALKQQKFNELLKENKKLKEKYENAVADYETTMFEYVKGLEGTIKEYRQEMNKVAIQQKEFIEWLGDYINLFDKKDIYEEGSCDTLEEILQKYKEIIGVSNENN